MQEKQYTIEKPILLEFEPQKLDSYQSDETVISVVSQTQERYLPWQEFKNKSWVPVGRRVEIWTLIKFMRRFSSSSTPITDSEKRTFTYDPSYAQAFLHKVDLELGGNFIGVSNFGEGDKRSIIRRNLIEESIASSQLEGANTSRATAKKMLREGRPPRDKDEQMIVNNHSVMRRIEEETKHEKMSLALLHQLHRDITYKTIKEEHRGILRQTLDSKGKRLVIKPWDDFTIAYTTPDRAFFEKELEKLILFANDELKTGFIHPLLKGIMLHFWVGLLHPYEDGNGRLARIIFYWYMLRKGYWAFSYLSLSEMILKSPKQYAMAYIYAEQDDNDLNYFIHYNITKLEAARKKFEDYMRDRITENNRMSEIVHKGLNINSRQLKLIQYLAKDEQRLTSLKDYHGFNPDIGKVTASTDLAKLVEGGYLRKIRNGKNIYYAPQEKIWLLLESK